MSSSVANNGITEPEPEPGPKRRKHLDAGGPVEDDETARQKMRDAEVYERGVDGTFEEYVGFDPDNIGDVKSIDEEDEDTLDYNAITPMGYFAELGDLRMMRWLYINGADTRDVDVARCFPMYLAAGAGHIEVCKWLFDHGAAKDVKRGTRWNATPLSASFLFSDQRDLNRWLILNGALCKDDESGDLDVETAWQDLGVRYGRGTLSFRQRKPLLEWATDLHRPRTSFLLFLSGTHSAPKDACSTRQNVSPLQLLGGKPGILELIGDYVGVVRGREARIIRQLTELLPGLIQQDGGKQGAIAVPQPESRMNFHDDAGGPLASNNSFVASNAAAV